MRRPSLVRSVVGAVLVVGGATSFVGPFSAGTWLPHAAATVALATAVSLSWTARRTWWVAALTHATVAFAYVTGAVVRSLDPASLRAALLDGPRRLLTVGLPADDERALLAVPVIVTYLASAVTVEWARRLGTRLVLVLPATLLLATGFLFGDRSEPERLWRTAAVVVLATLVVIADPAEGGARLRGPAAARARRRHVALAVPLVAAIAVVAALSGPHLPGAGARERTTLRDVVDPEARISPLDNPLELLPGLLSEDAPRPLLRVTTESEVAVPSVRIATFDRYDGERWYVGDDFVPAGTRLPAPPDGSAPDAPIASQGFELVDLGTGFVPTGGRALEIDAPGAELYVAPTTGDLVSADGRAPQRYRVRSVVSVARPERDDVSAGDADAVANLRLPPEVPPAVTELVQRVAPAGTPAPLAASALADALRNGPYRVLAAGQPVTTGYTYHHVQCFVDLASRCGGIGTREQFATAYVLAARSSGLPARLVLGAPLRAQGSEAATVLTHELTVWAEVKFAEAGWVTYDPVPPDATTEPVPEAEDPSESDPEGGGGGGAEDEEGDGDDETGGTAGGGGPWRWLIVLASVAGLLVLGLLLGPSVIRAARRRRRRSASDPTARVLGAWAEAVDLLRAHGYRSWRTATRADVVDDAGSRFGPPSGAAIDRLARQANEAAFSRHRFVDHDADAAWQDLDRLRSEIRAATVPARRVRAFFDLGSLLPADA